MKLRALKPGGKIGLIAPAFPPNPEKLKNGIDYLLGLGYELELGDSLTARHGYFAGSDTLRLDDIHRMFDDSSIDMVLCARGGWGGLRLLDKIDFDLIQQNPKALIGYSDVTTLQAAIWHKTGVPSFSGPMAAVEMGSQILPFTSKHFWEQIRNPNPEYEFDFSEEKVEVWKKGNAEGILLGGCLSMIAHQLGTPWAPDFNNSILFLEDVGEPPYKIDRYLAQMRQAGLFTNISALILGDFIDCVDENPERHSFTLTEVLKEYFSDTPYPVLYNFPYGHGMKKMTMPVGVKTKLDTNRKLLTFQNPFF